MPDKTISPIMLAAGKSKRFGSDKLLYLINGKPLIYKSLTPWLDIFNQISVVVRPDNRLLIDTLKSAPFSAQLQLIPAPDAGKGMSASLIAGIRANCKADGWLIGLADMPNIKSSVIRQSHTALQSGAAITIPTFQDRSGHPVGFTSRFLPQLLALQGDKGAKDILDASPDLITSIVSPDEGIYADIDTEKDLAT
ncbi:MAG: nucleotidyltransferase family protein [Methylophaga sp.]